MGDAYRMIRTAKQVIADDRVERRWRIRGKPGAIDVAAVVTARTKSEARAAFKRLMPGGRLPEGVEVVEEFVPQILSTPGQP